MWFAADNPRTPEHPLASIPDRSFVNLPPRLYTYIQLLDTVDGGDARRYRDLTVTPKHLALRRRRLHRWWQLLARFAFRLCGLGSRAFVRSDIEVDEQE